MSVFTFAPTPDIAMGEQNYAFWENGFSESQITEIIRIGESLPMDTATINGNEKDDVGKIRRSSVSWISQTQDSTFLYDNLAYIARSLNGQFFNFDLYGFVEDMQYTKYEGSPDEGGHYDWHMDKCSILPSPRKLSLVLQLSDPDEYEGGDLEFLVGGTEPVQARKEKGIVYAFPSWVMHRVTPVTRGTRRSLVVWVAGPAFR